MKKLLLSLGALSAVVAPVAAVVACGSTDSDSTLDQAKALALKNTTLTQEQKDAINGAKTMDALTTVLAEQTNAAGNAITASEITDTATVLSPTEATTVSVELQQINIENTSLSTIRTGLDVADVHNQYAVNSIEGFTFITYERTTKNTKAPISHLANIEVFLVPNSDISVKANKDFTVNEGSATEALLTKEKITATDFKALKAEIHSGDTKSDVITTSEDNKELLESGKPAQVWVSENENDFQYLMELNYKFTDATAKTGAASKGDKKLMSDEYDTLKKF